VTSESIDKIIKENASIIKRLTKQNEWLEVQRELAINKQNDQLEFNFDYPKG